MKAEMESIMSYLNITDDANLGIEIAAIENKGRGIKAVRDFEKGEFIVEYAGDLIDGGTAVEREANYAMDISKGSYMYFSNTKKKSIGKTY